MDITAMRCFLTEENIRKHIDYVNTLKLRLSILEKSFPQLVGVNISDLARINLPPDAKADALNLMWEIISHVAYFGSFTPEPCKAGVAKSFGISRERLIYDIYIMGMEKNQGFIYLFLDKCGRIKLHFACRYDGAFDKYQPILAIDICEHSYFSDYGFNKDKYLRGSLNHLDISKLS